MDLVSTVRKEGSRGGRDNFSWENVKANAHRQNYLGHSIMAPVGRWQQGRDLNWYSKADEKDPQAEADARKEEMRKIKEAEEDAMARALGQEPPSRANPNMIDVAGQAAPAERPARSRDARDSKNSSRREHHDRRTRPHSRDCRRDYRRDVHRNERRGRKHEHRRRSRSRSCSPGRERRRHPERNYSRSPRRHSRRDSRDHRESYHACAED